MQTKQIPGSVSVEGTDPQQPEFSGRQKFNRAGIESEELALCLVAGLVRETAISIGRAKVMHNISRRIERQIKRMGIWRD